jgi:hypothetical protein
MDESKLPRDTRGRPNRSYLGHTSELIQTPYPLEGQRLEPGQPRRFPLRAVRTYAEDKERVRLAQIENAGKCQSRRQKFDEWCGKWPMKGLEVCRFHGGKFAHSKKAAKQRVAEQEIMDKAQRILRNIK